MFNKLLTVQVLFWIAMLIPAPAQAQPEGKILIPGLDHTVEVNRCSRTGGPCRLSSDCCGDRYCEGGICKGGSQCLRAGESCGGTYQCCGGLFCDNSRVCRQ